LSVRTWARLGFKRP
jgi:bifunctional non-homologous end joining protein LigD